MRDGNFFDDFGGVQVQKVWRTVIIHSLVPNCQIPEFHKAKLGQDTDDEDWKVWFRNKHYVGMPQQLIHHTFNAWEDCLPDFEPIECGADKEKDMLKYVEFFRPLPSPMQTEFTHQNFYTQFKMELGGDPILFSAEPNRFSAVVDKVMATAEMHRLADEAMKVGYIPSESRRLQASLPKNHVQAHFGINLRLTTLNFYENREKSSGVLICEGRHWLLCVYTIEITLDKREI